MPASTEVPAGISAFMVIDESCPGFTGSGRREPPVNLNTDVPAEQSLTELEAAAFMIATVAYNALNKPIIYL